MEKKKDILKSLKIKKLDELPEKYLIQLHKLVLKDNPSPKKEIGVNKKSEKYKILLKLVNQILVNIGENPIKQLTEFKDVDRLKLIRDVNNNTLDDHATVFCEHFDKWKIGYMRKTDNLVLNVIRGLCKEINLKFTAKRKGIGIGNNQTKMVFLYSIEI
jgi:hypothetical protein